MRILRQLSIGIALLGLLVLLLITFNLARFGSIRLERFRETTWVIYGALLLFVFVRRDPVAYLRGLRERGTRFLAHPRFFTVMSVVLLVLYIAAAATQHLAFRTFSHDFSMIDTALSRTLGEGPLYSTVLGRSFLSEHFSPILFALVPLRAVVRSPWLLVLVQPVVLWASVLVLRGILDRDGLSPALRNLCCLVYLNHPLMISTLLTVFHMECFLPLFVLLAFDFMRRRRPVWAFAAFVGALAIKEDIGLYLAGAAFYWIVAERRWKRGLILVALSTAWVAVVLGVVFPSFHEETGARFLARWSRWGDEPAAVALGFLRHPIAVLRALVHEPLPRYFACLAFLPFFRPVALLLFLVPWLLNTTSDNVQQASLSLYYGIPVLVFACLAAVEGLRTRAFDRLRSWRWSHVLAGLVVMLNVAHFRFPEIPRDRGRVLAAIDRIPESASIQAMSCFFPVLETTHRPALVEPSSRPTADYVLLRLRGSTWPLDAGQVERLLREGIESGYSPTYQSNNFVVLERTKQYRF
jgi:uncharacterized membrane protein